MRSIPILAVLALSCVATSQGVSKATLLKGALVVVRPGKVLEGADVLLKDGLIAKVGKSLDAPDGADVVDCEGLTAYAGLIHPFLRVTVDGVVPSTSGLTAAALMAMRDEDAFNRAANMLSRHRTAELSQKDVSAFGSLAKAGYGVAQVSASGGLLGAQSAVVSLADPALAPANVLSSPGHVPVSLASRGFGGGGYPGSVMGAIAFVRQALCDAQRYGRMRRAFEAGKQGAPRPERDPNLESLDRVTSGEASAVFDDLGEVGFFQALAVAKEFGLRPVFGFRQGAGSVLESLKASQAPVMLKGEIPSKPAIGENLGLASLSSVRSYFNELQVAAELERNGVPFCYAPSSTSDPLSGIRTYVRAGLSKDAALASMTTLPAELLGVQSRSGTLEEGKLGNVLLTQGDLFDSSSQVMAVFVEGKRLSETLPARKKTEDLKPDAKLKTLAPNYEAFPQAAESVPAFRLYRNATIWTMGPSGVLRGADLLVRNGKIAEVGKGLKAPAGCQVVDATGKHISPGIWDCHSHTGIDGGVNEGSNMITVECRIGDVINHRHSGIYRQLSGGTVGALQLHGSANAIGGQTSAVKWRWGEPPTSYPISGAPPGVKFALGENPIREDSGRGGFGQEAPPEGKTLLTFRPRTRMGVEEAIRRGFQLGKEYAQRWESYRQGKRSVEPRRDLQLEGLAEIASGKRLIHSHGYRQDELLMLIRVAGEYGAKIATLQHVLEGYKIADEMAAARVGGSTFADWWGYKLEAYDAIPHNASLMADRGVSVSVNSDSDNHARRLNHEAAKAIRYGGSSPEKALSFVTIEPARQMGIDKWTGSLEAGKDADFAVWTTDPTSVYAICLETYVDGIKRYDRSDEARQREARLKELQEAKGALSDASNPFDTGGSGDGKSAEAGPSTASFGLGPVTAQPGTSKYPRKAVLIQGAMVHPMDGEPFVGDVLIGPDGRIARIGKGLSGYGATKVDGRGKHVYPGLIDPSTALGINEIGQVPVSNDSSERGDFHPDYRVERALFPEGETLGVAREQGVLTAVVRPTTSNGLAGQAALIHTEGYTWEDMTVQGGLAVVLNAGGGGFSFGEFDCCEDDGLTAGAQGRRRGAQEGESGQSAFQKASEALAKTREYSKARSESNGDGSFAMDHRYEALEAALDGKLPFLVSVNGASDIKSAVAWAEKEKVRVLLYGCSGAGDIADWLAQKKVPIVLSGVFNVPDPDKPTDWFYALPAALRKAGVRFCLSTNDGHNVRQLRDQAGFAAAFGLDREDAVRSMTLWTAEMLGVSDRLGAIKPGLDGTLILTDGDILETRTRVLRAWIAGREVELTNKQTRLYDKYRARPKASAGG